jgi:hypothetical protein
MADPNINEWVTYVGMALGGAVAAFVVRMGWRKGPPAPEQNLLVSGQAQITDMAPIKDLLKQVDLLCVKLMSATIAVEGMTAQQTRVALAIEALSAEVKQYLDAMRAEMEANDRQEEIDRESDRKARILAEDIVRQREEELAERRPPRKST